MIAYLDGQVAEVREGSLVLQAGPVGVELFAPKATLMSVSRGEMVRLHTHLLVKEELLALYGFHTLDLLALFRHLISVSGVGAKLALALLSAMPPQLVAGAIRNEDAGLLSSAPGVGKRTAERIILELRNKLPEGLAAEGAARRGQPLLSAAGEDAVQALLALGYREAQVKGLIAELAAGNGDESAEALIRKALARLR